MRRFGKILSMENFIGFIKSEAVLTASLLLAVVSAFFVVPNAEYFDYIDFRTLTLLFCLMVAMEGFKCLGIFGSLAESLLGKVKSTRSLCLTLCLICFFSSMLITNDVALITFVPFTVIVLKLIGRVDKLIYIVSLETISANLGSMLTPIGNPQNLYLFSNYNMSLSDFISAILPYSLLSFALVVVSAFLLEDEAVQMCDISDKESDKGFKMSALYGAIFILSILSVFRFLNFVILLIITLLLIIVFDRNILKHVDYSLLLTFISLFIFIGNIGNIESISDFLRTIVLGNEVLAGVLASQVFSNVPASILLSGFTENAEALLIGVNLGGLGTLIASMASLISFKFIQRENVSVLRYLVIFTVMNLVFLFANSTLCYII